jgi:hypothetical protein
MELSYGSSVQYRTAPTETKVLSSGGHEMHVVRQICRVGTNHRFKGRMMRSPGLNPFLGSGTRPDLGVLSNCLHDVWRCLFQWVSVSELRW